VTTPQVALIGTLDTKGAEISFVAARLAAAGARPLVVDSGVFAPAGFDREVAVDNASVAAAAGVDLEELRGAGDRGRAVAVMGEGTARVVAERAALGELDGVLALGGSGGSSIAARAFSDLPLGMPKLLVSTMASGDVAPYVGASDVTLMYSVVDIAGINQVSGAVLENAAEAVAAMARAYAARRAAPPIGGRPLIGASMFGVTTPAVTAARRRLEELGYEVLTFHATGAGGRALENLARSGFLAGVLDLTTTELADELVGGVLSAGPERVTAAGAAGVPQLVSIGALDMVNFGSRETVPERFATRTLHVHNPTVTLMRTTPEECAQLGRVLGEKLVAAKGPTVLLVPRGGVSAIDCPGEAFFDPEADRLLIDALLAAVAGSPVTVIEHPGNINDEEVAVLAADALHAMVRKEA
jgi:uncharacterized protein (UPF0261 family)